MSSKQSYLGYPGSLRTPDGKPVMHAFKPGLPADYKENNNNVGTKGTSSTPQK